MHISFKNKYQHTLGINCMCQSMSVALSGYEITSLYPTNKILYHVSLSFYDVFKGYPQIKNRVLLKLEPYRY